MKVGLYASHFGKTPEQFPDIESFIEYAYELRLDVIDLRSDVGFHSHDTSYLMETKMRCLERGLAIGYLASGGHFVGTDAELEAKLDTVRADVRAAALLGSPARNRGVPEPGHDIYRYMEQTAARASHVRAKFYKVDSGEEEWLDYPRIFAILRAAGYNGAVSVVFEGQDANAGDDREVLRLAAAQLRSLTST